MVVRSRAVAIVAITFVAFVTVARAADKPLGKNLAGGNCSVAAAPAAAGARHAERISVAHGKAGTLYTAPLCG